MEIFQFPNQLSFEIKISTGYDRYPISAFDRDRDRGYGERFGGAGIGAPQEPVCFCFCFLLLLLLHTLCAMFRVLIEALDDHFMEETLAAIHHMKCHSGLQCPVTIIP